MSSDVNKVPCFGRLNDSPDPLVREHENNDEGSAEEDKAEVDRVDTRVILNLKGVLEADFVEFFEDKAISPQR